jgi:acyl carrier protein
MTAIHENQVMQDLANILRDFHGRTYDAPIGPRTRFFADLGLASIDAVVLGETIEEHYGRKIAFNDFMADLGRRAVRDIELGELAAFLSKELNK